MQTTRLSNVPILLENACSRARKGADAVRAIERELGALSTQESGVLVDLFLSYRAIKAWKEMIALVEKMPAPLANSVMVQEQLAFALNRDKQGERAERVLVDLLAKRGPSSETCGLLGRVYKDRWKEALQRKDRIEARGLLEKAIETYARGFQADWRDAYPGVKAVTLMTIRNPPDVRRERMLPVVSYAVEQRGEIPGTYRGESLCDIEHHTKLGRSCRSKPKAKNPRGFGGQSPLIPLINSKENRETGVRLLGEVQDIKGEARG